jgi:hypothetical protein
MDRVLLGWRITRWQGNILTDWVGRTEDPAESNRPHPLRRTAEPGGGGPFPSERSGSDGRPLPWRGCVHVELDVFAASWPVTNGCPAYLKTVPTMEDVISVPATG